MNSITFEPVAGPLVLLAIALTMFGLLILRPSFGKLSKNQKWLLTALRSLAIGMALMALVRPGCISQIEKTQTGIVEVFIDQTRSMQLPHRVTGPTRFAALREMIEKNKAAIKALEERNIKFRWFGFDNELAEFEFVDGELRLPSQADGDETDIGSSVYSGVQLVRNQRLIAAILASDGVQNAIDPENSLNEAARIINDSQFPLYCVAFGQADESNRLADLSIENLADQFSVRVKNNLRVTATLTAKGFTGQQIPVQLVLIEKNGQEKIVDTVLVPIRQAFERRSVALNYMPDVPGHYQMLVRAVPQPSETAAANNQLPSFLTVEDRGVNVLLVYGSLDYEAQLLRRSLRGDSVISIDALPLDKRTRASWERDISSYLSDSKYDVVLLSNVDSRAIYRQTFQEKNVAAIMDSVASGRGFGMLGGYHSFGPGLYHSTPLAQILPIEMANFENQDLDGPPKLDYHIGGNVKVRPADSHFITRLGAGNGSDDAWDELPELKTPNRLKVKDSAQVLMETEAGDPIMAVTTVGGRVLAFAGADTWKWRAENPDAHKRFWRQTILWLAGQDGLTGEDVWIYMPRRRFQLGQAVPFTTGITSPIGAEVEDPNFEVNLVSPSGERKPLQVHAEQNDFAGRVEKKDLKQPGLYALEVVGRTGANVVGETRTEFVVFDNDLEKSVSGADPEQLARMAYQTREWGGKLVQPDDFSLLLEEISNLAPANTIEIPRRWRLGDTWQDALGFVLAFVGLLTTEWFLRKKWGLV